MHTAAHDNLVLAAPRPVRIATFSHMHTSPIRQHIRLASVPVPDNNSSEEQGRISASPRAVSPRPSLSSEALEEFLSILRFPPQSPTLRARRHPSHNLAFAHDRSHSLSAKPLERLENIPILSPAFGEDARSPGKQIGARITSPSLRPPREEDEENRVTPPPSFRVWANGPLASPVSRLQTRNPFQRDPSFENKGPGLLLFPTLPSTSPAPPVFQSVNISPSLVPLPSPTPSEFDVDSPF
ncbi:uncharacterized protein STEHIDRAFT_145325 [Stereum hirsutum FP-91666 SS1]|uniref:uncharacterized protein n=1 Tax=Stereum hirsutum (strain FP-91666) TaxID=721885 RepID=UPI000440E088|nr:uncharacterized protein STEHIDRAFT_145325 [Stereum hirsutum FP-91666 SS1]EIM90193.1 hypothetical protein STEHIDRAFT_145325 [Stereum hirsutum FP-91666 SS1]